MKALRKTEVNHFITKLNNDFDNLVYFRPISLRPVELASLLEKLEGIYDSEHSRIDRELVAIGSSVTVLNLDDYGEYEFQITLPEDAATPSDAISVLSPLGSRLLNCYQ